MSLRQEVSRLMGDLFGRSTEKMFLEYYDDEHPEEFLAACREMITKMLGPSAAKRHLDLILARHPEIKKIEKFGVAK